MFTPARGRTHASVTNTFVDEIRDHGGSYRDSSDRQQVGLGCFVER